jgi:hypothetical protein
MNLSDPRGEKNIREFVISVTANFTAEPIRDYLEFWIAHLGLETARLEFSAYNQVFQELASPNSLLSSNVPGVNLVLVRLEDWGRRQKRIFELHCRFGCTRIYCRDAELPGRVLTVLLVCPPSTASEKDRTFRERIKSLCASVRETQNCPG